MLNLLKSLILSLFYLLVITLLIYILQLISCTYRSGDFENSFNNEIIGAFFGALFPTLFLFLTEGIKSKYQNAKQHYLALVSTEKTLNNLYSQMDIIANLKFKDFINSFNKRTLWYGEINEIEYDDQVYENLSDLDLTNEIYNHFDMLKRLNADLRNLNSMYTTYRNSFINKIISIDEYWSQFSYLTDTIGKIEPMINETMNENNRIQAIVRLRLKFDWNLTIKVIEKLFLFPSRKPSKFDIESEIKILESEINHSRSNSRQRLNKIYNDNVD